MSSILLNQAADVAPSTAIFARTTVTSSERIAIPASFAKQFITFQAETSAVYIAWGTGAVTADRTARSALGSEIPTAATNGTLTIPAGSERTYRIPAAVTHFAHISADALGVLRFWNSTGAGEI